MVGKLLADLGATVVKIELPGGNGAPARSISGASGRSEASGTFLYLNSNKRSVVLDLSQAADAHAWKSWSGRQTCCCNNFTPQEMAANGLDYAHYRQLNARLVMLSITPFGLSGPYRDYAACDLTLYHGSGLGWLCPGKGTPLSLPPTTLRGARLHPGRPARRRSGHGGLLRRCRQRRGRAPGPVGARGRRVLIGGRTFATYTYGGVAQSRNSPTPMNPNHSTLARMVTSISSALSRASGSGWSKSWASRVVGPGRTLATRDQRGKNGDALKACISAWTAQHTVAELFHACQQARVGAAPVLTPAQLEHDAHLQARAYFTRQPQARAGTLHMPGSLRLQQPWWALRTPAPLLGEANNKQSSLFANCQAATTAPSDRAGTRGQEPPSPGRRAGTGFKLGLGRPHCTTMLAFLGAEVIKVESSTRLDITRRTQPFPPEMASGVNRSGYFACLNQAKKSLGINLSQPQGRELVKQLARRCDDDQQLLAPACWKS